MNVDGRVFNNDFGNGGSMSLQEALIVSCDTIFYNFGFQMWQQDVPYKNVNVVTKPSAPVQKMQKMELRWGFGQLTGVDLPEESTGTIPTREWLYYFWKDNAHTGQNWCKYGRANGTYIQQIEYQDCYYGNIWEPGLAVDASIGQGYVAVTPLQLARAYAALANGGTLYSPRVGEALLSPDGKVVQKITPPVVGHLPVAKSTLAYMRTALQGVVTSGTAAGAFAGFPLGTVCVAGKTGTAQVFGNLATSVFASFAPCNNPKYVVVVMIPNSGFGADVSAPAVRQIWDGIYGLQGHQGGAPGRPAARAAAHRPGRPDRQVGTRRDAGMSKLAPVPPEGHWSGGRSFGATGLPKSLLGRAFAKGSVLRRLDWILLVDGPGAQPGRHAAGLVRDPGRRPAHLLREADAGHRRRPHPGAGHRARWTTGSCARGRRCSTSCPCWG